MGRAFFYLPVPIVGANASSAAAGFDPANVANDHMGVVWKSAGGTSFVSLIVDLGAPRVVDTVAMFGCTGAQPGWEWEVHSSDDAAFRSGVTIHATALDFLAGQALPTHGRGVALWMAANPPAPKRYWRFAIGNLANAAVTIARIALGQRITLARNFAFGGAFGVRDLGSVNFSPSGVRLLRQASKLRTVGITFPAVTKEEAEAKVQPLVEQAAGQMPIVLVTDPDAHPLRQRRCWFGHLTGELGTIWRSAQAWEWRASLIDLVPIPAGPGGAIDATEPSITSAATFTVNENAALIQTATADTAVTWSKGGIDAGLVTLNTATGAWSLPAQDYEARQSVSFVLIATKQSNGLSAIQPITVTIGDVDEGGGPASPVISISGAQSAAEGDTGTKTFTFTVTRTGSLTATSSVAWALTGALDATDLGVGQATSGTVNFATSVATGQIVITTRGDVTVEQAEQSTITLSNPQGAQLGAPASATLTLTNDDEAAEGTALSAPLTSPSATPTAYPPSISEFYLQVDHKPAYSVEVYTTSDYAGATVTHTATVSIGTKNAAQMLAAVNAALAGFGIADGAGFVWFRVDNGATKGTPSDPIHYGTAAVPTISGSKAFEVVEGVKLAKTITLTGPARNVWLVGQDREQVELLGDRPGSTFTLRWVGDGTQQFDRAIDFNRDAVFDIGFVVESLAGVLGAAEAATITVLDLDELPDEISFASASEQELSTVIESPVAEITGISEGVVLTGDANGEQFRRRRNGAWGAYGTVAQEFTQGDAVQLRATTPEVYLDNKLVTFDVGPISATWSIGTKADPVAASISLLSTGTFDTRAAVGSDNVVATLPAGRHLLHVFVENNAAVKGGVFGTPFTVSVDGVEQTPIIRNSSANLNHTHSALYDITVPAGGLTSFAINGGNDRGGGVFAMFKPTANVGAATGSAGIGYEFRGGVMATSDLDIGSLGLFFAITEESGVTLAPQNGETVLGNYQVKQYFKAYWGTKTADGAIAITVNGPQGTPHNTDQSLFGVAFGVA